MLELEKTSEMSINIAIRQEPQSITKEGWILKNLQNKNKESGKKSDVVSKKCMMLNNKHDSNKSKHKTSNSNKITNNNHSWMEAFQINSSNNNS